MERIFYIFMIIIGFIAAFIVLTAMTGIALYMVHDVYTHISNLNWKCK